VTSTLTFSNACYATGTTPSMTDLMARGAPKLYMDGLHTLDGTPIEQWKSWEMGAFATLGQTVYNNSISNPP
jgi:hypothetical protein